MRRVVWERDAWLFLKRWRGLPEMVVIARHSRADPQPVPPWKWRMENPVNGAQESGSFLTP